MFRHIIRSPTFHAVGYLFGVYGGVCFGNYVWDAYLNKHRYQETWMDARREVAEPVCHECGEITTLLQPQRLWRINYLVR